MKIVFSDRCYDYAQPGHPESPERVRISYEYLKDKYDIVPVGTITDDHVRLVHTADLLELVKTGRFYDADSPAHPHIYEHAMRSAAGAVTACEHTLQGQPAFSLLRPPGHHAGREALGGFCYFNSVAIATANALSAVGRLAIIDFDCHHGNGTQDIFLGHDRVLYVSLHQSPLYPGTGLVSDGNCINYPLPEGVDEDAYMRAFTRAMDDVKTFHPELIAVSAGFDTYKLDPITHMQLGIGTYEKIGRAIAELGTPVFSVLEGGYSADLPKCIDSFLQGLR